MTKQSQESWRITNVRIVADEEIISGSLVVAEGKIAGVYPEGSDVPAAYGELPVVDGEGGWLLPGFIDVHVHGGNGAEFMEASREAFDRITAFHAANGTTCMLATTVTAPHDETEAVIREVAAYRAGDMPYAALHGVHLEGPFISERWPGAQNPAYIVDPQPAWLEDWMARWPDTIRLLTLAPERRGAGDLIAMLAKRGVIVACGHTDSGYDDIIAAVDRGLSHAVHTFNAMTPLHHRKPGTVGAVLTDPRICAEVIADGHHVHPAAIRLLVAAKPADKLLLITDAMAAAGLPDGEYKLGELPVVVKDGAARLKDGDTLAGSTLTMIGALRFMVEQVGVSVQDASRMASGNPAKQLGIADRTGRIAPGLQADLVWTDERFAVRQTWVKGRTVARA